VSQPLNVGPSTREAVEAHWHDAWWTCDGCHALYPRDYGPDYCSNGCGPRLRRNDDVRIALAAVGQKHQPANASAVPGTRTGATA
jgi:hypothetical protein